MIQPDVVIHRSPCTLNGDEHRDDVSRFSPANSWVALGWPGMDGVSSMLTHGSQSNRSRECFDGRWSVPKSHKIPQKTMALRGVILTWGRKRKETAIRKGIWSSAGAVFCVPNFETHRNPSGNMGRTVIVLLGSGEFFYPLCLYHQMSK